METHKCSMKHTTSHGPEQTPLQVKVKTDETKKIHEYEHACKMKSHHPHWLWMKLENGKHIWGDKILCSYILATFKTTINKFLDLKKLNRTNTPKYPFVTSSGPMILIIVPLWINWLLVELNGLQFKNKIFYSLTIK